MNDKKVNLEDSKLWQLAKKVADGVREAVKTVPYSEHFNFASAAVQNATTLTSDIAYAVGKGSGGLPYDFQAARGHLFTAKGLLLMAHELGFIEYSKALAADFDKLQVMIEKELDIIENKAGIDVN